ncbi:MAG: hypothetical protein AAF709_16805, partial [Pseudomonadota bacterium]
QVPGLDAVAIAKSLEFGLDLSNPGTKCPVATAIVVPTFEPLLIEQSAVAVYETLDGQEVPMLPACVAAVAWAVVLLEAPPQVGGVSSVRAAVFVTDQ